MSRLWTRFLTVCISACTAKNQYVGRAPPKYTEGRPIMRAMKKHTLDSAEEERQRQPRVTWQLVMTGPESTFEKADNVTRAQLTQILRRTRPEMTLRWLSDYDCGKYLEKHFKHMCTGRVCREANDALSRHFCRLAVLMREGGFFVDPQVEMVMPLSDLVDKNTSFMSVYDYRRPVSAACASAKTSDKQRCWSSLGEAHPAAHRGLHDGEVHNAGLLPTLLATEPQSKVLKSTMEEMFWHLSHEGLVEKNVGYSTLQKGLMRTISQDCPSKDLRLAKELAHSRNAPLQWACGPHAFRLYVQRRLKCRAPDNDAVECPRERLLSKYEGQKIGIFQPGHTQALLAYPCSLQRHSKFQEDVDPLGFPCWHDLSYGQTLQLFNETFLGEHKEASFVSQGEHSKPNQLRRIPHQLILTGPQATFGDLPERVKSKLLNVLKSEPAMRVLWFSDTSCRRYIHAYFSMRILNMFTTAQYGHYRGDICRTAVLLREGGFYMDLDVELTMPLHSLVGETTSFMASYEDEFKQEGRNVAVLNALMGVEPESPVMHHALHEMQEWINREDFKMGPVALGRALNSVLYEDCPQERLKTRRDHALLHETALEWNCGKQKFRFYVQLPLNCSGSHPDPIECSPSRRTSAYDGVKWGLFAPGLKRQLIGFPRSEWCEDEGCNLGGSKKRRMEIIFRILKS
mmetsp:Transcript_99438/g.176391  ORF Transcript_99438/g.176391 Transcript_99438/m.176391 type:complete len:684 (+) Transcript_99438:105-2156(+)